jgi:hypothetical protein
LRAAESLGAQHVLGIEINKEFAEGARLSLGADRRVIRRPHIVEKLTPVPASIETNVNCRAIGNVP